MKRIQSIKSWFNLSFSIFRERKLTNLSQLKDMSIIHSILSEIDQYAFPNNNMDLNEIFISIKNFYLEIIGNEIKENELQVNKFNEFSKEEDYLIFAEILVCLASQCDNKIYFLDIMQQELVVEEKKEVLEILNERILQDMDLDELDNEKPKDHERAEENDLDFLLKKNELLENEIKNLNQKISLLLMKNETLTNNCEIIQINYNELEKKYNEVVESNIVRTQKNNEIADFINSLPDQQKDDFINLSIQVSELRSKLESKENIINKLLDEKDYIYTELTRKNMNLIQEVDELKENHAKYEVMKENCEKMRKKIEEMNSIRKQNLHLEKLLGEKEEKLIKLKKVEIEKIQQMKKIEELNFLLKTEQTKCEHAIEEKKECFETIKTLQNELIKYRKKHKLDEECKIDENSLQNIIKNGIGEKIINNNNYLVKADLFSLSEIDNTDDQTFQKLEMVLKRNNLRTNSNISENKNFDKYDNKVKLLSFQEIGFTIPSKLEEFNTRNSIQITKTESINHSVNYISENNSMIERFEVFLKRNFRNQTFSVENQTSLFFNSEREDSSILIEKYIDEVQNLKTKEQFYQEKETLLTNMIFEITSELLFKNMKNTC